MVKEIFKTVTAGILVGLALYIMPVILVKILLIFILFKIAFRLMGFGWRHHAHRHQYYNMTDEQKEAFKKKFASHGCCSNEKSSKPE